MRYIARPCTPNATHDDLIQLDYDEIKRRLEGVEERSTDDFVALCPAHPDQRPSLHVTRNKRGPVLMHCHAGCEYGEVMEALLNRESQQTNGKRTLTLNLAKVVKGDSTLQDTYADRIMLPAEFVRDMTVETNQGVGFAFRDGAMKVRLRDGSKSKFAWASGTARKFPLWPIPNDTPESVTICEGETDCLTLRHAGIAAYTVTAGAKEDGTLDAAHYIALARRGVRKVTIIGDADDIGQAWMHAEAATAQNADLDVSIVDLTLYYDPFGDGHKDVNELWQTCGSVEEFQQLIEQHTFDVPAARRMLEEDEFDALADQEIDWLIPDLIARRDKVVVTGPPKSLKTYMLLDLTRALTTGTPFLERAEWTPAQKCRVLFVEEEGTDIGLARRWRLVKQDHEVPSDAIKWWVRAGFNLLNTAHVDQLIERVQKQQIDVLVLDPFQRISGGVDENSASETAPIWDAIHKITTFCPEVVVLVVHHMGKDKGNSWNAIRGSSRFGGEVDLGLFVQKNPYADSTRTSGSLVVNIDGREVPSYIDTQDGGLEIEYEINHDDHVYRMSATGMTVQVRPTSQGDANRELVLNFIRDNDGATRKEIEDAVGLSRNTVMQHLSKLKESDEVIETSEKGKASTFHAN